MKKDLTRKLRLVAPKAKTSTGQVDTGETSEDELALSMQEGLGRVEDENRKLRTELKEARRESTLFKMLARTIAEQEPFSTFQPYSSIINKKAKITESAVLMLSDLHADQEIVGKRVQGLEEYNFDIACQRAERIVDTTVSHLVDNMKNYKFERLYIAGLGDMVNGEIHDSLEHSKWHNALKNAIGVGELIAMMITDLSRYFPEIVFCSVSGNHGRRSFKKDFRGAQDNWDYMVTMHAITRLKKLINEKRLTVVAPDSWMAGMRIYDWNFALGHGDDIKCFAPGARVSINDGKFKNIENIVPGDAVLCSDGKCRSVNKLFEYDHKGEMVHISAEGLPNNTWCVTPNHEVRVVPGQKISEEYSNPEPEWIPAGHVSVGDYLVVPTPKVSEEEIVTEIKTSDFLSAMPEKLHSNEKEIPDTLQVSEDLGYVLGQYVADGSIFGKNDKIVGNNYDNILEVDYNEEESEFWTDFIASWENLFKDTPKLLKRRDMSVRCQRLHAYGQRAANLIAVLGGKGSRTKILHPSVLRWPVDALKSFLIGYLRGDGHTHRYAYHDRYRTHRVNATTMSAQLGMQLFWISRRCGFSPSLKFRTRSGVSEAQLGFYGDDARFLGPKTQRNYEVHDEDVRDTCRTSFPVEDLFLARVTKASRSRYEGKKYDIEVEGLHDYTVNGAIVHNSWNSIPWYGIERKTRRMSAIGAVTGVVPNYYLLGHFHNMATQQTSNGEILINGSWSATDEFALNSLGAYSEPYQWLFGVHPTYGITWRMPVKMRTKNWREEIGKPSRYSVTMFEDHEQDPKDYVFGDAAKNV